MSRRRQRPPLAREARGRSRGVGRTGSRAAESISDDLRLGTGGHLPARRRQAALLLLASASLGVVSLYQLGLIEHLPEPPLPFLDADAVDASGEAYAFGLTPDGTLGSASAAVSLALVGMGGADRARDRPLVPLLAAAKLGLDALGGLYLTAEQASRHRRFCSWCLLAAGAQAAAFPAALPEAREALRRLRR
ncbi:MAG: vitamin K epoxide reductase family protein [Actinomycetota bacterium]|nr:vitamin K epoxide reductase family protein [Actinomycetota bacterium]